ncbi:major capsid protein [Sporanaerobacter acetigenes]|uniref:major capsid protein n=1 Tax=Sporanaerobacter acetigenes TaxID=165813 RepID=UPI0018EEC757|nr:major capsid protein [Sporanaerobacter acetigenes]
MNKKFKMNLQLHAGRVATIYETVTPKEIASYWNSFQEQRAPYLGEVLFPNEKQLGLDIKWIKGAGGLPVALKPSAFDVETSLRDRIGFEEIEQEMPYFKEGVLVKEKDRQELLKVQASGNQAYIELILGHIFDDVTRLINGGRVQAERMRMQLLSTGKISIKANKLNYEYDYHFNEDNMEILTSTDKWSDPNADIVGDIERWMDHLEGTTGTRPDKAVLTKKTFNYIKINKAIINELKASTGVSVIMTNNVIEEYMATKLGLKLIIYNKKFKTEAGVTEQFFPDDVFTLLPPGDLGKTRFGTTPEEADLMSGATSAEVEIVETGMAVTAEKRTDPVNVFTKVSAIMLPSFENMDKIFIANV